MSASSAFLRPAWLSGERQAGLGGRAHHFAFEMKWGRLGGRGRERTGGHALQVIAFCGIQNYSRGLTYVASLSSSQGARTGTGLRRMGGKARDRVSHA